MVKHHGISRDTIFFTILNGQKHEGDIQTISYFEHTAEFIAKYDDIAFNSDKPKLTLEEFEPMVRRVLKEPKIQFITLNGTKIDKMLTGKKIILRFKWSFRESYC